MKKTQRLADAKAPDRIQRGLQERSGWWDRILNMALLWALLAVVALTATLLPRAGSQLPDWEPGQVASYDVVMPMDTSLPDPEATEAVRKTARENVRPVYDYEPRTLIEISDEITGLFNSCRESLEAKTLDEFSPISSDLLVDSGMINILRSSKCSSELENALQEVVLGIYSDRVVDDERSLERRAAANGLVLRNLESGNETRLSPGDLAGLIDIRSELEGALRARLLEQDSVRRAWLRPTVQFLNANIQPNIVYDRSETAQRVQKAEESITPRSQILSRGEILIRRGDRVTFSQARVLQYLNRRRMDVSTYSNQAGIAGLVLLITGAWWSVFYRTNQHESRSRLSIIFLLMILFSGLDRLGLFLGTAIASSAGGSLLSDHQIYLWALPHAAGAITVNVLLGLQPALLFAISMAFLAGIMLGGSYSAVVFATAGGLVAVLASQQFKERSAFSRIGMLVGLINAAVILVLSLWSGWTDSWQKIALEMFIGFLGGTLATGIASFLLPILERLFGITTDIRLLELSNQNLPLLKRLSLEAPGTYQHSLAVGNLVEAGASAIGANSLLLRVCAYYHDVGKLLKPEYFVENQRGENPHDSLSPSMSAIVIQSHVKEGLELAGQAKLPLPVRQAIATHHGTKLIRYFFNKATEQNNPEMGEIRESDYRYPGPKPNTKELGILLLADAIEAAARTIDSPTPGKIQGLVQRIVSDAMDDGQLADSDLTFAEIDKVASSFMWVLMNMYHHRIEYPGFDFNRPKADSKPA